MKKLSFLFVLSAVLGLAFTNPASETVNFSVDTEESFITWRGYKVTGKHHGKVKLEDGNLEYTDGLLSGGSFTIDMSSISVEDLEGNSKGKLEGHLKSADFFGVENHPTAKFVITDVISRGKPGDYRITGDLTIKETTNEIKFNALLAENGNTTSGTAKITLDRSEYDVRYGSGSFFDNLGDKTIYDEFDLEINLVANK